MLTTKYTIKNHATNQVQDIPPIISIASMPMSVDIWDGVTNYLQIFPRGKLNASLSKLAVNTRKRGTENRPSSAANICRASSRVEINLINHRVYNKLIQSRLTRNEHKNLYSKSIFTLPSIHPCVHKRESLLIQS